MVSQFVSPDPVRLLGDLGFPFPEGTHAVGRLDSPSEGLLLLTTDKGLTRLLYSGPVSHKRAYLVLLQNDVSPAMLEALRQGVVIPTTGGEPYLAKPVSVDRIEKAKAIYPYATDSREAYPHTWLLITLTEGKFRQVRKMVMAVRHRCLRLIRVSIGGLHLGDSQPGTVQEIDKETLFKAIGIAENR